MGGFHIRPLKIPYFRQIFCRGRVSRSAGMTFFGRDLSAVHLCENIAHFVRLFSRSFLTAVHIVSA